MNRERIYTALLAELQRLGVNGNQAVGTGVPHISREFQHWSDASIQPAIYPVPESEDPGAYKPGLPGIWTLHIAVWVYAKKDGDMLGVMQLSPILDAIEALFVPAKPPQLYVNTLGGVVTRCSISGPTQISGGYLGDQSVAVVPLTIVA